MSLEEQRPWVENFVWRGESSSLFDCSFLRDPRNAEEHLSSLSGHFAIHLTDGGSHLLARDPMGVNKFFFAVRGGCVASSNYLIDLLRSGYGLDEIHSVPSGAAVFIDAEAGAVQCRKYATLWSKEDAGEARGDIGAIAGEIQAALEGAFRRIREAAAGRAVYVTMSGGVDSTGIALLAKEHLSGVEGVTLSVVRDNESRGESEDVQFARRVAEDLGIPLTVLVATPRDILDALDHALVWGQDWRDFNLHCALVNAALGRCLAETAKNATHSGRPLLLTGDTMNEMMADYEPVSYRGREYYPLPRLTRGQLRHFLVTGLDSGDREVGVLAKLGFSVIQPYALCAREYLSVPAEFLEKPSAKQELARRILHDRLPEYVLARPKVRAQAAGSKEIGGTLAVLLDAGIDEAFLKKRWCELHRLPPDAPSRLIRAGVYKTFNDSRLPRRN
jgi:asparagine synthetase B (glutamine-hydrolysing)